MADLVQDIIPQVSALITQLEQLFLVEIHEAEVPNILQVLQCRCEVVLGTLHYTSLYVPSCKQNVHLVMEALTMLRDVSSRMDTGVEGWH